MKELMLMRETDRVRARERDRKKKGIKNERE